MQKAALRKIPLIAIGIFWFIGPVMAQDEGSEEAVIEWNEERPLEWADYPFRVLKSKRQIALTSVRHTVRAELKDGIPDFEVRVLFIRKDSWTSDTTNLALLGHEQLHFDIGELFRRRIEARVNDLRDKGEKQKAIYRYAIQKLLHEFKKFSNDYDRSSRYGNLKGEQAKWKKKVWGELNRLNK